MTQEKDLCPTSDTGYHRYFIFKVVEVFEPYYFSLDSKNIETINTILKLPTLYQKAEYTISGCNCGSSIKQKVKQQ